MNKPESKRFNLGDVPYFICIILIFSVIAAVVCNGWNKTETWLTILFLVGMPVVAYRCRVRLTPDFFDKNFKAFLTGFLIVMISMQLFNLRKLEFVPSFDLGAIYNGAIQWLESGTFSDYYDYYDWFPINLGGMCLLYVLFQIGRVFTEDYFLIAASGNMLLLNTAYVLIFLIIKKLWGCRSAVLAMLLVFLMPPFVFLSEAFYTDALSTIFPVLLFYLFLQMRGKTGKKKGALVFCFALVTALGNGIKSTILIMTIAIILYLLLKKEYKDALYLMVSSILLIGVLNFALHTYMYNVHLDAELAKIKNTPIIHWVMMGMQGNGGYNPEDFEFTRSFTDPELRNREILKEIKNRVMENGFSGMITLYSKKLARCFGDGTLAVSDFLDDSPLGTSRLQEHILYGGKYYQSYADYCTAILMGMLVLSLWFGIVQLKKKEPSRLLTLSFGGLIFLLMHWETNARYITNFAPVILIMAVGGLKETESLPERIWKGIGSRIYSRHQKCIKIFASAIGIRMAVYVLSVVVMALFGDYPDGITLSDFLEAWKRWDSSHYLNIAENGYSGAIENGEHIFLVFYPLYPWLIRILSAVFGDMRLCGMLISTVCFGIGSVYFVKCMEQELGERAAKAGFIGLSLFPFGFFMGSIATESLFYMVCMLFFHRLSNHRYGGAAFWGFLACLTKVQGLLLAFAVLAELLHSENGIRLLIRREWKALWSRVVKPGLLAANMLWGFAVYLMINYTVEGDPFRFMYYQRNHWHNGFSPIWTTMRYVFDNALETWFTQMGMALWVPEAILFFVYIWGIFYLYKQKVRLSYLIYLIAFFLLTYSSSWLISAGRYTLSAYPLFMAEALLVEKHPGMKYAIYGVSAALMTIYYIGYFTWKSIM